jgi:hypothetical protein
MTTEKCDEEPTLEAKETLRAVREETAKLHSGDEENFEIWQTLRQAWLAAKAARASLDRP